MDMSYGFRSATSVPNATEAQRSKLSLVKLRHATHLTCIGLAVVIAAKPNVNKGQKRRRLTNCLCLPFILPARSSKNVTVMPLAASYKSHLLCSSHIFDTSHPQPLARMAIVVTTAYNAHMHSIRDKSTTFAISIIYKSPRK